MAFYSVDHQIGVSVLTDTNTTALNTLGSIVKGRDDSYGEGEFIYLLGVGSTVAGSVVTYNTSTWQTTLSPTTGANGAPIAVALSANVASQYGWYQISGVATVKKTAVKINPDVKLYVSGTAGRLYATASAGKLVQGAKSANLATVVSATSTVLVMLDRPHLRGVTSAI